MRYVHRQTSLASVPLGGVGTGSFEVGADGRVPHTFRASFDLIDNYDRNDLMPEYLLIALLYYRATGDSETIRSLWPTLS